MAIPSNARAGWYPDPTVPGTKRYWDGRAWTGRTIPVTPPAPAVPPVVATGAPTAAAEAPTADAPPTPLKPPITTGVIVAGTVIGELGGL